MRRAIIRAVTVLLSAVAAVWLIAALAFLRLSQMTQGWGPYQIQAARWFLYPWGEITAKQAELKRVTDKEVLLRGNIRVRMVGWESFFSPHFKLVVSGEEIASPALEAVLEEKEDILPDPYIDRFDATVSMGRKGSFSIEQASWEGPIASGALSGDLSENHALDFSSVCTLRQVLLERFPILSGNLLSTFVETPSVPASSPPTSTEIKLFLAGDLDRPQIRLISDFFKLEIG